MCDKIIQFKRMYKDKILKSYKVEDRHYRDCKWMEFVLLDSECKLCAK